MVITAYLDVGEENMYDKCNLLNDDICGCYKKEKFIIEGYWLGSKNYGLRAFDFDNGGKISTICKMKGIRYE